MPASLEAVITAAASVGLALCVRRALTACVCFFRAADEPDADRRVRRKPVRRAIEYASLRVAASAAHAAAG